MPKFGGLLKELRRTRKLSQAKLAEALIWKQSKISYLEALTEAPKEDDLRAICDFFGIRPEYFYERREDRTAKALEYLLRLREADPYTSPKAALALAFYSDIERLPKKEQEEAVKFAEEEIRRRKRTRK